MAGIVEDDGAVLNRRAGRDVGDVVEHAVRRVVVRADVLPRAAADLGEERHLVERVAGDVGANLEAVASSGGYGRA